MQLTLTSAVQRRHGEIWKLPLRNDETDLKRKRNKKQLHCDAMCSEHQKHAEKNTIRENLRKQ